jgi:hypothetical protein
MNTRLVGLCRIPLPTLETICTDCARLVGPLGRPVEETLAAVSEFIFIKEDRFGEEIASAIGSTAGPTPPVVQGSRSLAGKAVPRDGPGGVTSRVLIPENIIVPIVYCYERGLSYEVEEERYIISHEIGHSWDFFMRRILPPKELTADEMRATPFRIQATAQYHFQRLAFEVAACVNSARAVSAELLSRRYATTRTVAVESTDCIKRVLEKLRTGIIDTRKASYIVSGELWSILTDCAQIFATISANTGLADDCEHLWADTPWENVLHRHLEAVRTLVDSYPQWPVDVMLPVRDVWQALGSELFNCRFVEGETEDRVVPCETEG